jgi:Ran GTPase-activating protein (RanGAP) involved in mRNA processing and transport
MLTTMCINDHTLLASPDDWSPLLGALSLSSPSLTSLQLSGIALPSSARVRLRGVFRACPLLACVHISNIDSLDGDGLVDIVPDGLSACHGLTCLRVRGLVLSSSASACLLDSLKHWPILQVLDAGGHTLSASGVSLLGPHLVDIPLLHTLELASCFLTPASVSALAAHVSSCPLLATIDLSANYELGASVAGCSSISRCPLLAELDVSYSHLVASGAASLGKSLASLPLLAKLDASYNEHLGDTGCIALVSGLRACSQLSSLDLSSTFCGVAFCASLAFALPSWPLLRELVLSSNSLGGAGCASVCCALAASCPLLHTLDVSSIGLFNDPCVAALDALVLLQHVSEIRVHEHFEPVFSGASACSMIRFLCRSPLITYLSFGKFQFSIESVGVLCDALSRTPLIKVLVFHEKCVMPNCSNLDQLISVLQHHPSIRKIHAPGTGQYGQVPSGGGFCIIKAALPRLFV